MIRFKLRSIFWKYKTKENRFVYVWERNYVTMLRHKKRQYFNNLNLSSITDNKLLWKIIFPLITEKDFSKNFR